MSWPVVGAGGKVNKAVEGSKTLILLQRWRKSSLLELWGMKGQGGSNGFELPSDRRQEAIAGSKTNYRKR